MQFCLYAVMIFVLYFGAYIIISTKGLSVNVGQLSALLTYSFQILNSLMMVSMVFVMITMSAESAKRIVEVLEDESTIKNPNKPIIANITITKITVKTLLYLLSNIS